ncbi:uracil-DNA glycosylase [bacterium]|nr:uracil-DNA glycosylase [bacterium]
MEEFRRAICNCKKCPLGDTRNRFVYGVGDQNARLVLVGEAPGADEDKLGEPFVGRAGQLLDKILAAVNLSREKDVYICNILKCRPPRNRDPLPEEVEQCEPHLVKQLQLLQPQLILALGRVSAQTLLKTKDSLSKMRGKVWNYHGIDLMVTFHPAALLRNPQWKRPTWEDIQQMKKLLDEKGVS